MCDDCKDKQEWLLEIGDGSQVICNCMDGCSEEDNDSNSGDESDDGGTEEHDSEEDEVAKVSGDEDSESIEGLEDEDVKEMDKPDGSNDDIENVDSLWYLIATYEPIQFDNVINNFRRYFQLFGKDPVYRLMWWKINEMMNSGMDFPRALDLCMEAFRSNIIESAENYWEDKASS